MKGIYLMLAMFVLVSSCKKKSDSSTPFDASAAQVKSISQEPGIGTSYFYDGQGRLESITNTNGTATNISYSGDTVREALVNDSGSVYAINTLFLNSSGVANSSVLTDTFGSILSSTIYLYDTANFRIDEKNYDATGNLVAHKTWNINVNDVFYYSSTDSLTYANNAQIGYTYAYDRESTIGNYNCGQKYYGRSSKNLEATMHKTGTTGNVLYTFQYTFDNSGRVSTKAAYNHLNELVYTNTYTYN
jgi:YD repeat-containing protein